MNVYWALAGNASSLDYYQSIIHSRSRWLLQDHARHEHRNLDNYINPAHLEIKS